MALINQYPTLETLSNNVLIPTYDPNNGDTRKMSIYALINFIVDSMNGVNLTTQYYSPNSSGFTVSVTDSGANINLIMTPSGTLAAGTIKLPSGTKDGQTVVVNSTQAITSLSFNTNGATSINGQPTTLSANGFFTLRYDLPMKNWYRIA